MSKNTPFTLIILSCLGMLTGCWKDGFLCKDAELSIKRQDYTDVQLRIDGYYYSARDADSFSSIYYFYRNGIFLSTGVTSWEDAINGTISIDTQRSAFKHIKKLWGTFNVNGDAIDIEKWQPVQLSCFNTYYQKGDIISDTTFVIVHTENRTRKGKSQNQQTVNDTFYFHQSAQKPDSTNDYIQ